MAKKHRHEEHEEHPDETWLVPYSDVLTLLLALFIVLFAMSQIDQEKVERLAESFRAALGAGGAVGTGPGILDGSKSMDPNLVPQRPGGATNYDIENIQLENLQKQLDAYIDSSHLVGQLNSEMTSDGLLITIKDAVLFRSASAELLPESRPVVSNIAKMLTSVSQKVVVSGHTDTMASGTAEFPTNWELSSKRAINFMRYMLTQEPTLQPERFSAVGYGEYQPIAPNYNEQGRQRNRRVEVLIMRSHRDVPSPAVLSVPR